MLTQKILSDKHYIRHIKKKKREMEEKDKSTRKLALHSLTGITA